MTDVAELYAQLPHAGRMRLIDSIESVDDSSIIASAGRLGDADYPLRINARLPALCGIEFAAQAAALHAAWLGAGADASRPAFVVTAKNVEIRQADLGDSVDTLSIRGERVFSQQSAAVYTFEVFGNDRVLLQGQLGLMMAPDSGVN